ncbi:leukocyte elastase inhibitor [Tribolium castaneum]|uniref:Serpin peptidase inhibitor 29 n=1 Tax=Tribolium castaneum TaxID=7070 RepID=D6WLU0_TRICA|nr:PREDICTED: leukocyte elastase inhibitor [Tribolium castaneum]EFA04601.2 serpin peptidase inhibitor 29 [Tribolium castaneum]|eukprot:XP_973883.2 PREDICTED: leukocyte elastase inhibitor [Tribolium castaneum]
MTATPESQILQANASFALNLYEILSRKKGNIFFSPLSVHAVLSMLYQGAQGETAQALAHALKNPDVKSTAEGYRDVIAHLGSLKDVTLLTANKIYGNQAKSKFLKAFEDCVVKNFGSEIELLDLGEPKGAARIVNKWVEDKTREKIKNIVNEALFNNKNLSLVLINAIYFKGDWLSTFKEQSTKKDKFYLEDKTAIEVEMMHQKEHFYYKDDQELGAQIIEMPYKGSTVKMMIILPKDGIGKLEEKLPKTDLKKLTDGLKRTELHLFVPKFKMEETIKLNQILIELGLKPIFDMNQADFKGILDTSSLQDNIFVSEVIQKAFVEVNETGTVAAAATRAAMVLGCAPGAPKPVIFRVDKPAVFLIVASHGEERNVLFLGRLSQPEY